MSTTYDLDNLPTNLNVGDVVIVASLSHAVLDDPWYISRSDSGWPNSECLSELGLLYKNGKAKKDLLPYIYLSDRPVEVGGGFPEFNKRKQLLFMVRAVLSLEDLKRRNGWATPRSSSF